MPGLYRTARRRTRVSLVARNLVIKVTAGKDEPERCNQAFTVAATAVASGVPVSLWLTGESAWFGLPGRAEDFSLPHAAPLADLLAGVLAAGSVTVCTQCAARRNIEPDDLISGIRIAGAATFVAEIMTEGAQALVYLARHAAILARDPRHAADPNAAPARYPADKATAVLPASNDSSVTGQLQKSHASPSPHRPGANYHPNPACPTVCTPECHCPLIVSNKKMKK